MKTAGTSRRAALAFTLSAAVHIIVLALVINQVSPTYELPEAPVPPMDIQITELPEPPPPVIIPPRPKRETKPVVVKPLAPVKPLEPKPTPPPTPSPPKPAPVPARPKPLPPAPTPLPSDAKPIAAPRPELRPAPTPPLPPAPRTAPTPPAPVAAPSTQAPLKLNIHKAEKDAPANVPTLPLPPSPIQGAPAPRASGAEAPLGGSRLSGLVPYPPGSMPSGGGGIRGSLVGCANADAVSLSAVERARCNERFGGSIGTAPVLDGISPAKRAVFDRAAERNESDRRYRDTVPRGEPAHPLSSGSGDTSRGPSSVIPSTPPH